jgi:hypothetical protein
VVTVGGTVLEAAPTAVVLVDVSTELLLVLELSNSVVETSVLVESSDELVADRPAELLQATATNDIDTHVAITVVIRRDLITRVCPLQPPSSRHHDI